MTGLEASVRDQIALYVQGYISADRLNDVLPDTSEVDDANDAALTDLTMLVIGHLAEYQAGYRLEESLRESLSEFASSWATEPSPLNQVTILDDLVLRVRAVAGTPLRVVPA